MRFTRLYKAVIAIALASAVTLPVRAQQLIDSNTTGEMMREMMIRTYFDSINKTISYQHGKIPVKDIAELNLPDGYKYIPADKAQMILHDLWGNPERTDVLGMVVKENYNIADENTWAFIVSYDDDGYVKDEDADKIDYAKMLTEIQESEPEVNEARVKEGYSEMHLVDWAASPYYDKENKVLHWAKKLKFSDADHYTLNYDVRILGRKGVLSMNAIGTIDQLADINTHIPQIIKMAVFTDGNKYKDFNPSMDKVAAYAIGGLIAGKLIAKTGLLLLLLKNIKLILIVALGGFGAFRKKIAALFTRKRKDGDGPQSGLTTTEAVVIAEPIVDNPPTGDNHPV
jgi:uncharacterized membrane-anchored protein